MSVSFYQKSPLFPLTDRLNSIFNPLVMRNQITTINRNWEVLLLCFVCALLVFSGNLFLLASKEVTPYPLLNNCISLSAYLRQHVAPIGVVFTIGVAISNFLPLPPRRRRLLIDLAFALIMARILLLF